MSSKVCSVIRVALTVFLRVGDQHYRFGPPGSFISNGPGCITANPFEEPPRRISEYTAQEIATLQARLDKQLGPEYISTRPGASGQKVHYLAAEKCINLANEVFGFNGWSSAIQNIQVDFVRLQFIQWRETVSCIVIADTCV